MDLYLLAELKTISLKGNHSNQHHDNYLIFQNFSLVTTVDMQKPPPDFRSNFEATPPPILIDGGLAVLENEKIERHIMKNIPGGHNLFVQDKEVAVLIENVYSVSWALLLVIWYNLKSCKVLPVLRRVHVLVTRIISIISNVRTLKHSSNFNISRVLRRAPMLVSYP